MIKKLTALVLTLLFALQLTPSFAFSDTEGTDYEQAVDVLLELDIIGGYEDKTFRPLDGITRAEFAAMVVRLLDTSVYTIPEGVVFKDVGKKHWAFEYVNAGFHIGYFSGYGDGIFAPDENISFSEIVKTMVTILGYKPVAEARGGYPTGYIVTANEKDILDGLSLESDALVTRGDVAQLIYNCLDTPKLEQTAFGSDSIDYTEDPKRTILTDELKVNRYEGIVTASKHTGLYGISPLATDEILIGDTKLATGKSDISSYVGYNLVVYAKKDKKTKEEAVLLYEIKEENTVTTVVSDDIDPSTNFSFFSYWIGDKQKSTALSGEVQLVINGKYEPMPLISDIKPTSGTVTLLSNDYDNDIDIIIVKRYSHYVIDSIDSTDLVIYDKYGKAPLELEPEGKNVDYKIIRNGSNAKFKNLSVGAVISVMQSVDGEFMEINIVTSPVRGKVTGMKDSDTYIIGEDNTAYQRSCDLPASEAIEIGYEGTFYLDIEGRIIKVEAKGAAEGNYCWLIDAGTMAGLQSRMQFKILNSQGEIEVVSSAEKISFNGIPDTPENIVSYLGGAGTVTEQPLRYSKNSLGEINKLETPSEDYAMASRKYRRSTKMFGYTSSVSAFLIDSEETVMFQVPTGGGSDDSYKVLKYDDLDHYDTSYSVTGYDLEDLTVACAVINVADSVEAATISGSCCVLTAVTQAVDDSGEIAYKIKYMNGGKKQESIISDKVVMKHYNLHLPSTIDKKDNPLYTSEISASDLKPGDVFHVMLDSNDKVISLARVLSVGGTDLSAAPHIGVSRGLSAEKTFGVVQKRVDYGMLLHVERKPGEYNYDDYPTCDYLYDITKPGGSIYLFDSRNNTVTVGTANDIIDIETAPGDPAYAYVRCGTGLVKDVVVFYQSK